MFYLTSLELTYFPLEQTVLEYLLEVLVESDTMTALESEVQSISTHTAPSEPSAALDRAILVGYA